MFGRRYEHKAGVFDSDSLDGLPRPDRGGPGGLLQDLPSGHRFWEPRRTSPTTLRRSSGVRGRGPVQLPVRRVWRHEAVPKSLRLPLLREPTCSRGWTLAWWPRQRRPGSAIAALRRGKLEGALSEESSDAEEVLGDPQAQMALAVTKMVKHLSAECRRPKERCSSEGFEEGCHRKPRFSFPDHRAESSGGLCGPDSGTRSRGWQLGLFGSGVVGAQ